MGTVVKWVWSSYSVGRRKWSVQHQSHKRCGCDGDQNIGSTEVVAVSSSLCDDDINYLHNLHLINPIMMVATGWGTTSGEEGEWN